MTYLKVNEVEYPAIQFLGKMHDLSWDGRETKTIKLEMGYDQALSIFKDNISWAIVEEWQEEELDPTTGDIIEVTRREEYDNSEFNLSGPILDHRDGTLSITMGKLTDLEVAYQLLYGGK